MMVKRTILLYIGLSCSLVTAADICKNTDFNSSFDGTIDKSSQDMRYYQGYLGNKSIVGELRQKVYRFRFYQLNINYDGGVDYQLMQNISILCPQTADFLYEQFTPLEIKYIKGSRHKLEQVVDDITGDLTTDKQKALALMRFCRDLYKKSTHTSINDYIYGGTEEELIEKGEILCETLARLMVALCEVAAIPGRIVFHHIGGHLATEVYIDGQWGYIDPRMGMYFEQTDGSIASVWELIENPLIIWQQSEQVKSDVVDYTTWYWRAWKCANFYFNSYEINTFGNYSLADSDSYDYHQISHKDAETAGLMDIARVSAPHMREILGLTDDMSNLTWQRRSPDTLKVGLQDEADKSWIVDCPEKNCRKMIRLLDVDMLDDAEFLSEIIGNVGNEEELTLALNLCLDSINQDIIDKFSNFREHINQLNGVSLPVGIFVSPQLSNPAALVKQFQPEFVILDCDSNDMAQSTLDKWVSARNMNGFDLYSYLRNSGTVDKNKYADYIRGWAMVCLRSGLDGLLIGSQYQNDVLGDSVKYSDLLYEDKSYILSRTEAGFAVIIADDLIDLRDNKSISIAIDFFDNKILSSVCGVVLNGRIITYNVADGLLKIDCEYFKFGTNNIQFVLNHDVLDESIEALLQVEFSDYNTLKN